MGKMRRREPEPETIRVELDASPLTAADRLDPRFTLDAPAKVQQAGPEATERWATEHAPHAILTDHQAHARRDHGARQRAYTRARIEARRAGRPLPAPDEFFVTAKGI